MPIIKKIKNIAPVFGRDVYVAENATIVGDVTIGDKSSIWFNAVLRGDVNSITIGKNVNIQVINPTEIISSYIKYELKKYKLQSNEDSAQYKFYISNYTKSFAKSAKLFFKQELDLEQVNLWTK